MFSTTNETNARGLNEKLRVKSLYEGRDFLGSGGAGVSDNGVCLTELREVPRSR